MHITAFVLDKLLFNEPKSFLKCLEWGRDQSFARRARQSRSVMRSAHQPADDQSEHPASHAARTARVSTQIPPSTHSVLTYWQHSRTEEYSLSTRTLGSTQILQGTHLKRDKKHNGFKTNSGQSDGSSNFDSVFFRLSSPLVWTQKSWVHYYFGYISGGKSASCSSEFSLLFLLSHSTFSLSPCSFLSFLFLTLVIFSSPFPFFLSLSLSFSLFLSLFLPASVTLSVFISVSSLILSCSVPFCPRRKQLSLCEFEFKAEPNPSGPNHFRILAPLNHF